MKISRTFWRSVILMGTLEYFGKILASNFSCFLTIQKMRPEEHTILLREIDALAYDLVVSISRDCAPEFSNEILSHHQVIKIFLITKAVNLSAVGGEKTGKEKRTEGEMMFSHLSEKFTKS